MSSSGSYAPPRRDRVASAAVGAMFAITIVVRSSAGDPARMTFGDGILFRYVAQHLGSSPAQVANFLGSHGPALRYGRIGLPVALWLASGGRPGAMQYAQPALMVVAAAAIAAATRALFPRHGLVVSLSPFIAVGLSATLAGGFAEPLATALLLWAIVFALGERWWLAAGLFAGAMLTRENAATAAAGVALWQAAAGKRTALGMLAASAAPVIGWHLVVAAKFGHLPLLDPWNFTSGSAGVPLVALARALSDSPGRSVAMIAVHLAIAIAAWRWWRQSPFAAAAAVASLQLLATGPYAWRFVGDAARLTSFLDVFALLALISQADQREQSVG